MPITDGNSRRARLLPAIGTDEMNLAEFPLGALSDRISSEQSTLAFTDHATHPKTGELVERQLSIEASQKYGLPNAVDDEVILGLVQLTKLKSGFSDPIVRFTRYEALQVMRWDTQQTWYYQRLVESLRRWVGVTLYYNNAWWDIEKDDWITEDFHILDNVRIPSRRGGQISVTWNRDVVFHSFQSANLKRLDLDFYFSLEHRGSRRAYRYLHKNFYRRYMLRIGLRDFACGHVGLSENFHNGKLKERLRPIIEELEEQNVLEPLAPSDRYVKVRRGEWDIVLAKKKGRQASQHAPTLLGRELEERGVAAKTAEELIGAFDAEQIREKIELHDWLKEKQDRRISENPAGYLIAAIRENYTLPDNFKTKEQRASEAKVKQQRVAAKRREEQEERRDEEAKRREATNLDHELDNLDDAERADILEAVLAANETCRKLYRRNPDSPVVRVACRKELKRRRGLQEAGAGSQH